MLVNSHCQLINISKLNFIGIIQTKGCFTVNFYERFIKECAQKNVSPSSVAYKAGFNKSIVSYWKNRSSVNPKMETIQKIAEALGVPVSRLTGDEWDASLSDDEVELIADYNKLTSDGKKVARERVHELTEISRYYDPDNGVEFKKGE